MMTKLNTKKTVAMMTAMMILTVTLLGCLSGCKSNDTKAKTGKTTTTTLITTTTTKAISVTTAAKKTTTTTKKVTTTTTTAKTAATTVMTDAVTDAMTETPVTEATTPPTAAPTEMPMTVAPTTTTTKAPTTTTTKPTQWYEKQVDYGDEALLIERTIYHINRLRNEEGTCSVTVLPVLSEFSQRRSVQLTEKFEHNTDLERQIAEDMQYGRYVDPAEWGDPSRDPYWDCEAREAIGMGGMGGSIDALAREIAEGFQASSGHWSYVGAEEYSYMGIGITLDYSFWYVCLDMSGENLDAKYGR